MIDFRWKLMQGLLYALHTIGRDKGRFVFAVAAKPEPRGIAVALADTTAIPAGDPVRAMARKIIDAHIEEIVAQYERKSGETWKVDPNLPARSWKA